jgi:large subunit ribosomal protein L15
VTPELLREQGLISSLRVDVKVLGDGELSKNLTVTAHRFSASAREKIERAGGKVVALREAAADKPKRSRSKAAASAEEPATDEAPTAEEEPAAEG